jgi:hypothetical protein
MSPDVGKNKTLLPNLRDCATLRYKIITAIIVHNIKDLNILVCNPFTISKCFQVLIRNSGVINLLTILELYSK